MGRRMKMVKGIDAVSPEAAHPLVRKSRSKALALSGPSSTRQ
jgi:hypothetical protein